MTQVFNKSISERFNEDGDEEKSRKEEPKRRSQGKEPVKGASSCKRKKEMLKELEEAISKNQSRYMKITGKYIIFCNGARKERERR